MATAVRAVDGTYDLDRTHSSVQFAVRHLGVSTFRGSFGDVEARLTVENGAAGLEARAVAESVSIVEPPEFREHVVRGEDFFAANDHPLITFRSTGAAFDDEGGATITGQLTIRGVSRAVSAGGTFTPPTDDPFGGERVGLELSATIDRRDWGLDWQALLPSGGDALGWNVELSAHLEFTRIRS
jgi:polyisoprenoid-binding protein YceI